MGSGVFGPSCSELEVGPLRFPSRCHNKESNNNRKTNFFNRNKNSSTKNLSLKKNLPIYIHIYIYDKIKSLTNLLFYVLTLTAFACSCGPEATSLILGLDNSMDGSDDLLDPLLDGEINSVFVFPYQTHNI